MIGLWGPQSLMSKNISPIDADFANIFFKPIAHYLSNPETAEVMVNAHDDIWVEDNLGLRKVPETFTQDALVSAVNSLAQYVGRPLMENVFAVDARMPDGSRVCIVLPPVSGKDPIFAIRKFKEIVSDLDFLVKKKTLTDEMVELIDSLVKIKKNMMVSGGTSSGKTTLLNLIAAKIPDNERILTIEDSRELQLKQEHVLALEARPADKHGKGEFSIRQCLKSTLRLRPDRIIVGEIRGGEAFDLIQAMNTGHGGCMGTVHANTPTDTLRRIESLALTADVDMPLVALRSMIASALDVIICPARLSDGSRRIVQIAEIYPLTDKGDYHTVDIVRFVSTSRDKNSGQIKGYFEFTGHVPSFFEMFEAEGVPVPLEFFRKRAMGDIPTEKIPELLEKGYEVPGQPKPEAKVTSIPFQAQAAPVIKQPEPAPAPIAPVETTPAAFIPNEPEPTFFETPAVMKEAPQNNFIEEPAYIPEEIPLAQTSPSFIPQEEAPVQTSFAESFESNSIQEELPPSSEFVEQIQESSDEYTPTPLFLEEEPVTQSFEENQPIANEVTQDDHFASNNFSTPQTSATETPPNENQPKRPSLLERLSKLSGSPITTSTTTSAYGETVSPEAETTITPDRHYTQSYYEPVQEEAPQEDQERASAYEVNSFDQRVDTNVETTSENFQEAEEFSLNDAPITGTEKSHSFVSQDEYEAPKSYSFEEEEAPSYDFAQNTVTPAESSFNPQAQVFAEELPQTAAPAPEPMMDEKPPENKQHAVIAEILKRMRENKSNG